MVNDVQDNFMWGFVGLWEAMARLMACPFAAWGQESRPEIPARSGPSSVPRTEVGSPSEIPDVMPEKHLNPSRPGLSPLTPEQHEEAERLRKLAAKYGIDRTAIVGRAQFSSQYLNLPQGRQDVLAQRVWQVDWERNAKACLVLELEVGRSVVGRGGCPAGCRDFWTGSCGSL